jgi:beta-phosphoglucomutase-like phosphatase (HAD superfamily)
VIQDAPAGVTAGIRAGMTSVGVATTHPASALDTPHVIPDLSAVTVLSGPAGAIRLGIANWRDESNRQQCRSAGH